MVVLNPLSPQLQEIANKELFEVPSRIPEDLNNFKLWISQQPHLKVRNDDQFLIQFLRGSKYSLEKAKERIDLYYTLQSKYPELFVVTNIHSPELTEIFSLGCFSSLPRPLSDCGPRIVVFRFNFTVPDHDFNDVVRASAALQDLVYLEDPYACIYGVIYIMDVAKFNGHHFLHVTPGLLKKAFAYFTKTLPVRVKAVYFINTSSIAMHFFKLVLPLFPEKIRQRICMCGDNMKELTSHLPLRYLPKEYGGDNGSLDELTVTLQKSLNDYSNHFKENENFGVDESLRPGKPMDFDSIFGMDGSFRKLEVD